MGNGNIYENQHQIVSWNLAGAKKRVLLFNNLYSYSIIYTSLEISQI